MTTTPADVAAARPRRAVPLRDLGVAPENVRFREAADDDIPQLAATIKAAGVLMPLTVRPGRRKEKPLMALDGRRRLLALALLVEAGDIDDGHPVEVVEETDPARQAAAALLTNTALPVNVADVVVSIGRMLKSKLSLPTVAAALGYGELEVRRLAALAGLHGDALEALRQGRISLKEARLLARLPDRDQQAEIARAALAGLGFQTWRVTHALQGGRITTLDRRFAVVGIERYKAAGGRVESDLFGELPDALVDEPVLDASWRERASAVADALAADGLTAHVTPDWRTFDVEDGLEPLGYVYANDLPAEDLAAYQIARGVARALADQVREADLSGDDGLRLVTELVRAEVAAERAGHPGRVLRSVTLSPAGRSGLEIRVYAETRCEEDEALGAGGVGAPSSDVAGPKAAGEVDVPVAEVDVDGVRHALHEVRTDVATRGLIRALADDPGAALVALIARLFTTLVLEAARTTEQSGLAIIANGYARRGAEPIETLDGDVRRRLADRRAEYRASDLRPIPWVAGLAHGERMTLLAELTALTVDVREERTTSLRRQARADAADIAALTGADIADHWTPEEPFLAAHKKPQLLAMLDEMGAADPRARGLKKDELVSFVAERAATQGWAPPSLKFGLVVQKADESLGAADAASVAIEADEVEAAAWPALDSPPEVDAGPPTPVSGDHTPAEYAIAA